MAPFGLSQRARDNSAATGGGDYLNPSKIQSGKSVRFHITSEQPTEFFECWGETADGSVRPFRFIDDPTPADIKAEMGPEYDRRMNREGTAPEPVKMVVAFWVYNYDTQKIELCSLSQKSLVRELDQITQLEDYQPLDNFDLIMGKEGSGLTTVYSLKAVPRKKDAVNEVSSSWDAAESAGYNIQNLLTGDNPFKAVG
jgi:hypothetical protein